MAPERVLALAGELDIARRSEVAALLAALDDGDPLVVDLTGVEFIDHQTVAMLVRRRGGVELRGGPPSLLRIRRALAL